MTLSLANLLRPSVHGKAHYLEQIILSSQDIAKAIASGKEVSDLNLKTDHPLVKSLLKIQSQLKITRDDAKSWVMECLVRFSEIFNMTSPVEERYQAIVNTLVRQLNANYAVLYIVSDDEQSIEAKAAYGIDKKSYPRFEKGEGLAGQCFEDREPVEITTPGNFIKISSGLGSSAAAYLFLVPLVFFNKVVGVIEVASFSAFSAGHKELLTKAAQSIAGFIVNVKNIEQTNQLLSKIEELNKLTENKLKQQEEIHQKIVTRLKEKLNQTK